MRRLSRRFQRPDGHDITCRKVVSLVTDYLEGRLTRSEQALFEVHLAECEDCTEYLRQIRTTIALTGQLRDEDLDPLAREDLVSLYRRWRRTDPNLGARMTGTAKSGTAWPAHLRPAALRWARASSHYDETIAFYRDIVGLPIVDRFSGSFGEDGTIFGLPDTTTQLEIVRAHAAEGAGSAADQLVLYFDGAEAAALATVPLRQRGLHPESTPPEYWAANGAVIFSDPDGRGVVFAPWVYGRDPDPADQQQDSHISPGGERVEISEYTGDRTALRRLFEEAEDSAEQLDRYLRQGRVLVARSGPDVIGHLQLVETASDREIELKNMAVQPSQRGSGVGRRLIQAAVGQSAETGHTRMIVATAAADLGNLRFYQRCGFRFSAVERDAFTPETGYPDPVVIEGIPLRDRLWLARDVESLKD